MPFHLLAGGFHGEGGTHPGWTNDHPKRYRVTRNNLPDGTRNMLAGEPYEKSLGAIVES